MSQDAKPISVGKFTTRPSSDVMIYDFGAVAVIYSLPIEGPFEDLLTLSEELYDNEALLADSRLRVRRALLKTIGDAAVQPHHSSVVEDYVIFHVENLNEPLNANLFARSMLVKSPRFFAQSVKRFPIRRLTTRSRRVFPMASRMSRWSIGTPRCSSTAKAKMSARFSNSPMWSCWRCATSIRSSIAPSISLRDAATAVVGSAARFCLL